MMNKAATRQFKTRNEEGQFLGQMAYHERSVQTLHCCLLQGAFVIMCPKNSEVADSTKRNDAG